MEFSDLAKLIKNRRSIRRWQDKAVSAELIIQAIELATWAPNGGNQQNWHFFVILSGNTIGAIADTVQARAEWIASLPGAEDLGVAAGLRERASFFRSAPAVIAVASSQYQSGIDQVIDAQEEADPQAHQIRQGRIIADTRIQSVSAAIAYLLLILHQMGLGAVWMTGPMQAKREIEKILSVPPELDVVAFIPVGYPAENPVPKERRPVKEICTLIN